MTLAQLCERLAAAAQAWFADQQPSTTAATLVLSLVLFGDVADARVPLVQVEDLQLGVPEGWWPAQP